MNPPSVADSKLKAKVEVIKDKNGIDQVLLQNLRGASALVSLHGGQVLSWKTDKDEELLFMSNKFGSYGSLDRNGFARNRMWAIDDNPPPLGPMDSDNKAHIDLLLKSSEEVLKIWPHMVALDIDGSLSMTSRVRNVNGKPLSFSIAYHTYLSISDISEVRVEGLETLDYLDNMCHRERFTEQGDALTFESEVDRVYLSSSDVIAIFDHEKKKTFVIKRDGLPDIVVWNPWDKKSKGIADIGDEEYKHMLCVDGAVIENPIILKPVEEWTGRLDLSLVASFI